MPGATFAIKQAVDESGAKQQQREQRTHEAQQGARKVRGMPVGIDDAHAPGAHADGLAALAPGNDEIQGGDDEQCRLQQHVIERRLPCHIDLALEGEQDQRRGHHPYRHQHQQVVDQGGDASPEWGCAREHGRVSREESR